MFSASHLVEALHHNHLTIFPMKKNVVSKVALLFFFQAEDGIRDTSVTGVQTCALPISADEEENLKQMPRRKRAIVRKALASGLTTSIDTTTDDFYPLYALNMHNHGTPALPRRFFERLRAVFSANCEILTVREKGRPISSVLSFYFKDRVMPYYMGAHADARRTNSNDLMYW